MRPFFSAIFIGSLLIGFIVPIAWVLTAVSGLLAIFSAPAGERPDGASKTGGLLGWLWDDVVLSIKMRECPHCLSKIYRKATKCSHCGEWVNEDDESKGEGSENRSIGVVPKPVPREDDDSEEWHLKLIGYGLVGLVVLFMAVFVGELFTTEEEQSLAVLTAEQLEHLAEVERNANNYQGMEAEDYVRRRLKGTPQSLDHPEFGCTTRDKLRDVENAIDQKSEFYFTGPFYSGACKMVEFVNYKVVERGLGSAKIHVPSFSNEFSTLYVSSSSVP